MSSRKKMKFLKVGGLPNISGEPHSSEFPVEVFVASEAYNRPIYIVQGCGHGLMGGFYSVEDVVRPEIIQILKSCECSWLVGLLDNKLKYDELILSVLGKVGCLGEVMVDVKCSD